MKIKVIDYGYEKLPNRAHSNDAGADVFSMVDIDIAPNSVGKIPLGMGLRLPDGYMANIFPKSGLSIQCILDQLPPIDSGYTGEIHAIVLNAGSKIFKVNKGDKIGQLVIIPIVIADFIEESNIEETRGSNAFGSTGK